MANVLRLKPWLTITISTLSAAGLALAVLRLGSVAAQTTGCSLPASQPHHLVLSNDLGLAAWSPDSKRVGFVSQRIHGNEQIPMINIINADGSSPSNLVSDGAFPAWSPDGKQIAYLAHPDNHPELYRINADGSGAERLTVAQTDVAWPTWSPDGKYIAYISAPAGIVSILDLQTREVIMVTSSKANNYPMAWSPDSQRLLFISRRSGYFEINLVSADGSRLATLTGNGIMPVWSPDGRQIAYVAATNPIAPGEAIYRMAADGSNPMKLVDNGLFPSWSPDGRLIAFVANQNDGTSTIAVMNADGTGLAKLAGQEGIPLWSPDGKTLLLVQQLPFAAQTRSLSRIHVDGSGLHVLTDGTFSGLPLAPSPVYSPDRQQIAFLIVDHLCVSNANGTGAHLLSEQASSPTWTADGKFIVFVNSPPPNMTEAGVLHIPATVDIVAADGTQRRTIIGESNNAPPKVYLPLDVHAAALSPDGTQLVIEASDPYRRINDMHGDSAAGPSAIYRFDADGSNPVRLADGSAPVWSPNSQQIAFVDNDGIYVMDRNGANRHPLAAHGDTQNDRPVWSPDGRHIAFESGRSPMQTIEIMDANGANEHRVTGDRATESAPAWLPDSRHLVFSSDRDGTVESYVIAIDGTDLKHFTLMENAYGKEISDDGTASP